MLTYMLWAVFVWLSITYASLIYRMLDPGTEDQLVKTWLVSIGLNQVSDLQSAAITLVEVRLNPPPALANPVASSGVQWSPVDSSRRLQWPPVNEERVPRASLARGIVDGRT